MNENIKMVLKIFGGLWVFSAVISIIFFANMKDEFFKDYKNAADDYVDAINNTADNKSTRSNKGMPDNWVLGDGTWIEKTRSSYYIDEFHEGLIYLNGMVVKNEPIDKVYKQFKDKVRGKRKKGRVVNSSFII